MCNFVHLHHHTSASSDGMGTTEAKIDYVKSMGQTAIAITDHGTLSNVAEFSLYSHSVGIKPILGNEVYIDYAGKIGHLTVLSSGKQGYNNLVRLNNAAHQNFTGYGRGSQKPAVTLDMLDYHKDGLIVLTGCPASPVHSDEYSTGLLFTKQLHRIFGDRLWAEIMFPIRGQDFHSRPLQIAKELGLQPVFTNDSHFVLQNDYDLHTILQKARTGYTYESKELWLKSRTEVEHIARLNNIDEEIIQAGCDNTVVIADSIEAIELKGDPILPHVEQDKIDTMVATLYQRLEDDILLHPDTADERRERLEFELGVLRSFEALGYIYITNDLTTACRDMGIMYTTRGSAAGSYVLYLLQISQVDPIHFKLLFERFLNVSRKDMPDVDLDVDSLRRSDILQYANDKWGMKSVSTISTYSHSSIVRDIVRVMNLPLSDEVVQKVSHSEYGSDAWNTFAAIDKKIERFYEVVMDQTRQVSRHAAAIASIPKGLPFEVPIERQNSGEYSIAYTEGNKKFLQSLGIVKFDMLGIRALTLIDILTKITGDITPLGIPVQDLPSEIYTQFIDSDVTGVFQYTSDGMVQLAKSIGVENIDEVGLCSALYRPGALDAGLSEMYGDVKHGRTELRHIDPRIDTILAETNNVICYQEQVMSVYATVTGSGLAGANLARKALSPKSVKQTQDPAWIDKRDALCGEFYEKGIMNGFSHETIDLLWHNLETHSRYSFNKSHSCSYGRLSAIDLWYKKYYPKAYFTALLQIDAYSPYSNSSLYVYHAIRNGATISMPDINNSTDTYSLVDGVIYMPLSSIKFFGSTSAEKYLAIRAEHGKFATVEELQKVVPGRVLNKRTVENLRKLGALNSLSDIENVVPTDTDITEILGFVLPQKWQVDRAEYYRDADKIKVGWIKEIKPHVSKAGNEMKLVVLEPYSRFAWCYPDQFTSYRVGEFIGIVVDEYAHIVKISRVIK